jgi:hypothetical protein
VEETVQGVEELPRRTDELGQLCWQLIGPEDGTPDVTAAIPLIDKLTEMGDHYAVTNLWSLLIHMARDCVSVIGRNRHFLQTIRGRLYDAVLPYLFDTSAAVLTLAAVIEKASVPVETKKSESLINTIRVVRHPGQFNTVGQHWMLPDGTDGIVVRVEEGFFDVLPTEHHVMAEGGMSSSVGMSGHGRFRG